MRQIKIVGILVIFTMYLVTSASSPTPPKRSADEVMIRANVEQMAKGWNAKSAAEFAKPFAADADYVINNGMHVKSFPANVGGLQRMFETLEKTSVVKYTIDQIRFLRKDVAVIHMIGEMKDDTNPALSGQGRITLVMTKEKGKWMIATFQNTGVKPGGPPK